ncbi:unnamed protein product [Arctia plantaginis]|uniref:Uncharacterized protein n=1 Tax=Arctia plantaginis TaxID=874455 RepID=A0A8S0ZI75_ARCPL|nr:unnamed protein product [Arctia plantaginis]
MDDTQQSRTTDAAATRKRRSSILKSQRPARTPFSELEFNVATPTDTAKSRRVSFSKRTGVAEYVTNEATNTWKHIYEEHNKSLESSGNDSEVNPARQTVEHLGRRIFDQQFEEVEVVDFIGTLAPPRNSNTSFNNINFSEQIASLDCTSDAKLTAPNSKFELSALTDQQSKLFCNDFTVTGIGESSGKIDFNFSNIQRIGEKDDLDEIERDLGRVSNNVVCSGPVDHHNMSEYIEVDLNMTHVAKTDDCDMSITDTISTPKVQDVSKSNSIDKINNLDKDWITDKENIAINPYVTPPETDNFAVNDEPDQVLVFDGKRLTLQTEKCSKDFRQTLLPNTSTETPLRKTIVLNTDDDLPNFVDDASLRSDVEYRNRSSYHDPSICVQAVHKVEIVKRPTMNDNAGNMSVTQSLPTNIMSGAPANIKTIIYNENETANISMTQSVNGQIFTVDNKPMERRRTVVYENENCNISITQALPTNIIQNEKPERRKTIVFDDDKGNISVTQALPSQFIVDHTVQERRKTIIYDDDKADVSITQALPSRVILDKNNQEKRKTIVFDDDNGNISITQALPANIVLESRQEKRKTILYEDDAGDISVTQAAPTNLILIENPSATERRRTVLYEDDTGNISVTQTVPQNIILSKTDVKEDTQIFDANISMTQVLPTNIIIKDSDTNGISKDPNPKDSKPFVLHTLLDMSDPVESAICNQYAETNVESLIVEDDPQLKKEAPMLTFVIAEDEEIQIDKDDSGNNAKLTENSQLIVDHAVPERRKTIIYEDDKADVSITQSLPSRVILDQKAQEKRKTIVFDDDNGNISTTQVLPVNIVLESRQEKRKTVLNEDVTETMSVTQAAPTNLLFTENPSATELIYQDDTDDISVTQAVPQNIILDTADLEEEGTQIFDAKISMTQAYPTNIVIKDSDTIFHDPKPKESKTSVLHTLLDMSDPVESVTCNKDAETDVEPLIVGDEPDREKEGSMVSFIIAEDEGMQTDKIESDNDGELNEIESDTIQFIRDSRMSVDYKQPDEILQNTLAQLMINRGQMDNISPNISNTDEKDAQLNNENDEMENISRNMSCVNEREDEKVRPKSFKDANDTKELLDMICDFTDNSRCSSKEEAPPEEISPEKEEPPATKALDLKELLAIENKMEVHEPRRLSFATKRQSIIISREDLLSNISMAQAVLQKSRVEFDESSLTEDNQDSSPEELRQTQQRSNRMSNEVVKTLHFDDESLSESSMKSDLSKTWPIKKTVFGETSYAKVKTNVIPSYLKDVSDGIKQLMSDLVKPMSDAIPFESPEEKMKRSMSTVSTQIQANLITSSQIDVNTDLSSATGSHEDIPCYRSGRGILKMPGSSEMSSEQEVIRSECSDISEPPCRQLSIPEPVLVFDHENPLNNILLGPLDYKHTHDYKPLTPVPVENLAKESEITLCGSERSTSCQINMEMDDSSIDTDTMASEAKDVEVNTDQVVTQYSVAVHAGKKKLTFHKSCSIDRAVNVHSKVEDSEVNTVIAMKPNKELLETSSSLTLIDSLSESESKTNSPQQYIARKERRTPTKPVTKLKALPTIESDISSTDDSADRLISKGKKRTHIPVTPNRRHSVEVTPKPNNKMLKISSSPNQNRLFLRMSHEPSKLPAERDTDSQEDTSQIEDNTDSEKKPHSHNFDSTITIQQLITEYQIDAGLNKEILDVLKETDYCKSGSLTTEAPSRSDSLNSDSIDKVCSFTSSKNLGSNAMAQTVASTASSHKSQSTIHSAEYSRTDWHPELTSLSSTKNVNHIDSGVNIVSKIDMLPFMGSYECERETSLADTWSFRLLHGRIRLTIRLAHRHDNSTRTRVRADTPVTDLSVDTIEYDKKNPVAILCIRFACETMRYMVSSATETKYLARDVPLLLRRCAAVARVALRWGRAMHDAKLHLAYTLDTEGHLTVKVANIPLRSVWEVSMNLELVVEHPNQAPWPRASDVKVKRVVSDVPVSDEDIRKALKNTPNDWGHAPKTLWRIFRYLKHKQREDDGLLLGV